MKCESRQSGRALLARLGFAAISRRDLHCRVCRGREERAGVGSREAWTEKKEKLEYWLVNGQINLNTNSCFRPSWEEDIYSMTSP